MKILLKDLTPGGTYYLQLRSVNGEAVSDWSKTFTLNVQSDVIPPKQPTNVQGSMSGTSFNLTWDAVTQSIDNSPADDLDHYEVFVQSSGSGLTRVYKTTDTHFELDINKNFATFGSVQANIQMAVQAVDRVGNTAGYTTFVNQTNPAPAQPTGLVATGMPNAVLAEWDANTEDDLLKYVAYVGTTSGFTPNSGNKVWEGASTNFTYSTIQYSTDLYVKVTAMDYFGSESTAAVAGPVSPTSPTGIDSTAPDAVTGLAATMTNSTDESTATANVSWNAVADTDGDLAGYIIGYRPSGESDWQYVNVDYTQTSTKIYLLKPYTDYNFRIRSSDWSSNLSAWSSTVTATKQSNTAPSTPAAPTASTSTMNVQVTVTGNKAAGGAMESDVVYYEVYASTSSGFTAANSNRIGEITAGPAMIGTFQLPASGGGSTQTWYVRVIAVDRGGLKSAASAQATAAVGLIQDTNITNATITSAKIASLEANKITAGTGVIADLTIKSKLTLGDASNNGIIESYGYVAGTTGFHLDKSFLEINQGSIAAAALKIQTGANLMPLAYADFEFNSAYYEAMYNDGGGINGTPMISLAQSRFGDQSLKFEWLSSSGNVLTRTFRGSYLDATDLTTYTFSSVPIGTASTTRRVVVAIGQRSTNPAITSVTIGGIAATKDREVINGFDAAWLFSAVVPTGTTANVVVTYGATQGRCAIGVWTLSGLDSNYVSASGNGASGATSLNATVTNIQANDHVFGLAHGASMGVGWTWTNLTEDFDIQTEFIDRSISGATVTIPSGTSLSVTALAAGSTTQTVMALGAYRPVTAGGGGPATVYQYFGESNTDYNVALEAGKTYIWSAWVYTGSSGGVTCDFRLKQNDGTFLDMALNKVIPQNVWTQVTGTFTASAGVISGVPYFRCSDTTVSKYVYFDGLQIEEQTGQLTTPSAWKPPASTTISGYGIKTGEIRSNTNVTVNGMSQPAWSINLDGGAQFGDANIRGTVIVGADSADSDAGESYIASGNYVQDTSGFKLDSSGKIELNEGAIRGDLLVDGTVKGSKIALGVLRTNLIGDSSFEDEDAIAEITQLNQGNPSQWRKQNANSFGSVARTKEVRRSGSSAAKFNWDQVAASTDPIYLYSPTFEVSVSTTYRISFNAVSNNGSGSAVPIQMHAVFGPTKDSIDLSTPVTVTEEANLSLGAFSDPNAVTFETWEEGSGSFTIAPGETDLFCSIRLTLPAGAANGYTVYVDDVAVVKVGDGGATELTGAGVRIFDEDGYEATALVANRPNYLSVQDRGVSLASVGADGGATFTSIDVTGDLSSENELGDVRGLTVGGEDLQDRLARLPQGLVAHGSFAQDITITNIQSEYGIYDLGFQTKANRIYRVTFRGGAVFGNEASMAAISRVRYTFDGSAPTVTSQSLYMGEHIPIVSANEATGLPEISLILYPSSGGQTFRLLYTLQATYQSGTGHLTFKNYYGSTYSPSVEAYVEDLGTYQDLAFGGIQVNDGGGTLYTGGTNSTGGGSTSTAKKTYTSAWKANDSQTRRGVSTYGNYTINPTSYTGTNYMLAGYYSSTNGNQTAYIEFTSANSTGGQTNVSISTALSGATVSKVELYVKNASFYYNSGGSQRFGFSTLTGVSAASSFSPPSTAYAGASFSVGQSKWITLNSEAGTRVKNGGRVAMIGPGSSNSTTYYSKWYNHNSSYKPQLRITYTK